MSKQWIDWSDWRPGQGEPAHPFSQPLNKAATGADATKQDLSKVLENTKISVNDPRLPLSMRQPTEEEFAAALLHMAPHLNPEFQKARDAEWNDRHNNLQKAQHVKIESGKTQVGRGPIREEVLTEEEERIRRIRTAMDSELE